MEKISKYFNDVELVGPEVISAGKKAIDIIDPKLLVLLDALRDEFGPITINNWSSGGQYHNSGYRSPECTIGAKHSQHKLGKAADCKFANHTPQEVYVLVMSNPTKWMSKGLTCVENIAATPTWFHVSTKDTGLKYIQVVNP